MARARPVDANSIRLNLSRGTATVNVSETPVKSQPEGRRQVMSESFWGSDRVQRVHPRLVAELLLDSIELHDEPQRMMRYLREEGYSPDFIRCKGYLGLSGEEVVCILPFTSDDMEAVAGMGVRRRLDQEDEDVTAHATIVRTANGVTPVDFTALDVRDGDVRTFGPARFDELIADGVRAVGARLAGGREVRRSALTRLTKGRAIAAAAVEDLAQDERNIGFISASEYQSIVNNVEFYADIARVHSYLAAADDNGGGGGCKGCTSSSCYACTSCSCGIFAAAAKVA
jgi:hypothetical protein